MPDVGNVKLHKLLYYCQGWHLGWTGEPMFVDSIEAWANGPVVADLWHAEKKGRTPALTQTAPALVLGTIGFVLGHYGSQTGKSLIQQTHRERPWVAASEQDVPNPCISREALREFFQVTAESSSVRALRIALLADPEGKARLEQLSQGSSVTSFDALRRIRQRA